LSVVATAWDALRAEARQEPGWHLRRIHVSAPCTIFAALRQPGEAPGLVVEVPAEAVPFDVDLPQSRGLSVEGQLLGPSHGGRARFSLALSDPAYLDVFAVLCDHVAGAAAGMATARLGVREWLRQLHVWQAFLARHGAGGLSDQAVIGLMGELVLFRDHLAVRVGAEAAVLAWAGPAGEPNDFSLPGGFLEVKASARQAPDAIPIANLAQLDDRRGAILLAHVRFRPDPAGETLPDLVAAVRLLLEGLPRPLTDFNARLLAAGYLDMHADLYADRWKAHRLDLYAVHDDFPRLTRADVRAGVRDCSYSVSISDCAPYIAADSDLDTLVGAIPRGR